MICGNVKQRKHHAMNKEDNATIQTLNYCEMCDEESNFDCCWYLESWQISEYGEETSKEKDFTVLKRDNKTTISIFFRRICQQLSFQTFLSLLTLLLSVKWLALSSLLARSATQALGASHPWRRYWTGYTQLSHAARCIRASKCLTACIRASN